MTRDKLKTIIQDNMAPGLFRVPGAVLFSPLASLTNSPFYLMGLNPGGNPAEVSTSILDADPPSEGTSAYTHECWRRECSGKGACKHEGAGALAERDLKPHQKRVINLARMLGYPSPASMPSANAIFARSTGLHTLAATGYSQDEWFKACWPVHQHLLKIVRPRVIVSLGYGDKSSPFGFFCRMLGTREIRQIGDKGRLGGWLLERPMPIGNTELPVRVVGIPHPSRSPVNETLGFCLKSLGTAA